MTSSDKETSGPVSAESSGAGSRRSIDLIDQRIDSRDLFAATREITISHSGETYRLRLTAQNKLILTK